MGCSSGPDIIQDGLVLCLDAASKRSYPGTGTSFNDIAGSNNATAVNNLSFDSDNAGVVTFDGTDDYLDLNAYASNLIFAVPATISLWFKPLHAKNASTSRIIELKSDGYRDTNADSFRFDYGIGSITTTDETFNITCSKDGQYNSNTSLARLKCIQYGYDYQNQWVHVCLTMDGSTWRLYLDTQIQSLYKSSFWHGNSLGDKFCGHFSQKTNVNMGRIEPSSNGSAVYGGPWKMANFQLYNKVLSLEEIRQNYLSTKERFV